METNDRQAVANVHSTEMHTSDELVRGYVLGLLVCMHCAMRQGANAINNKLLHFVPYTSYKASFNVSCC